MRKQATVLLGATSTYSIGEVLQKSGAILLLPLLTAYFVPKELAVIGLLQISANLLDRLATPYNAALVRYYYHPEYHPQRDRLVFSLFVLCLLNAALIALLFFALSTVICGVLFDDMSLRPLVQWFALLVFINPVATFLYTLIRQQERSRLYIVVSTMQTVLAVAVTVMLLAVARVGLYAVVIGLVAGKITAAVTLLPLWIRSMSSRFSWSLCRAPLAYAYPLLPSAYSNLMVRSGDRYIIRWLLPLAQLGIYNVGYGLAAVADLVLVEPLKKALQPMVLKQEADPETQKTFIKRTATVYYGIGLWLALGISLFAREGVMVVAQKEAYYAAWTIIPVIVFAAIFRGLGHFMGYGLLMTRKSFHISAGLIATAMLNIGLNIMLIPWGGLMGAAFATLVSYLFWVFFRYYFSQKFYGLTFEIRRLLIFTVIWCGLVTTAYIVDTGYWWADAAIKAGVWLLFPIITILLRLIRSDEWAYLRDAIRYAQRLPSKFGLNPHNRSSDQT